MSPKIIFGMMGSSVASGSQKMATPNQVQEVLDCLKRHKVTEIDTARVYNAGRSEELLGECKTQSQSFLLQTKAPGFSPGSLSYDNVKKNCYASLKALGVSKVDIYYFHGPDRSTPLSESLRAANELYAEGCFDKLGISNHSLAEMREIDSICSANNWVKPSVHQAGYNPMLRGHEAELIPFLRSKGIAYYAFSPLAGGFLAKSIEEIQKPAKGSRFDAMKVFGEIYLSEATIKKRTELEKLCREHGMEVKEATLRWFMHHGGLGDNDGVILGASSVEQAEENLVACEKGALPGDVVKCFEELWEVCEPLMRKWVS